jgi:hypothetical protein
MGKAIDQLPEHHLHGPGQAQPDAETGDIRRTQRQPLLDPHVAGDVDQAERAVGEINHQQRQIAPPQRPDRAQHIRQPLAAQSRERKHLHAIFVSWNACDDLMWIKLRPLHKWQSFQIN